MKWIGIDLGGHTISAGLISPCGTALEQKLMSETPGTRRATDVMERIASMVAQLAATEKPGGIGIAIPGMVDADRRHARRLPNFHQDSWDNLDVEQALQQALAPYGLDSLSVIVENDANCYALGEGAAGEAQGISDFVVFTLGTGIGGGIVIGGKLLVGYGGMAGEVGHMVVAGEASCGCGGVGHVETFSAADGTSKRAAAAGLPEDFRLLWLQRGSEPADQVIEPGLDALARAVATISHVLDPQVILLGGGMAKAPGIREAVAKRTVRYLSQPFKDRLDLRISKLGEDAALFGAASLYRFCQPLS